MNRIDPLEPRRFDDVIGQDEAVSRLRALVPTRDRRASLEDWRGRSVLLFGPEGTGKRTLADLYARALLCAHSAPSPCGVHGLTEAGGLRPGSPCCPDCRDLERGEHPNLLRFDARFDPPEAIAGALGARPASERMSHGHAVLIIAAADRLPGAVRATLGGRLGRADRGVSLVVCAETGDTFDPELRTRVPAIPLAPPSLADRAAFIDRLSARAGLDPTPAPAVLTAIAAAAPSRGAIRRDVSELYRLGALTPEGVAAHYGSALAPVLAYLNTLAEPTGLEAQIAAAETIVGLPLARIAAVEAALDALFLGHVLRLPDRTGVLGTVPSAERAALVDRLTGRGLALGFEARAFWEALVGMFAPPLAASDASFRHLIAHCDRLLSDPRTPPPPSRPRRGRPRTRPPTLDQTESARVRTRVGVHLTVDHARDLWEAGSFLVQARGVAFNAGIDLLHRPLKLDRPDRVGRLMTELLRELRSRVRRRVRPRGEGDELYAAYVHEHAELGAPRPGLTRLVLHIPACVEVAEIESWLRTVWLPRHCPGCDSVEGMQFSPPPRGPDLDHPHHLTLLRLLTRGLDPAAQVPGRRGFDAPRLIDVLGIPPEARGAIGPSLGGQRKGVSRAIDRAARRAEAEVGLPVPSLWEHRAWGSLTGDYAVVEHERRRAAMAELDRLAGEYPDREGPAIAQKRAHLLKRERQRWSDAAVERIRAGGPRRRGT